MSITFNRVVAPRFNRPVDEDAIAKPSLTDESIWPRLDGDAWIAGEALSLADLLLAPPLSMFAQAPEGARILPEHENLKRWLAHIEARPSMVVTTWDTLLERKSAPR